MPVFAAPILINVNQERLACLEDRSSVRNLRISVATTRINVGLLPNRLHRKLPAATEDIIMAEARLIRLQNAADTVVHGQDQAVSAPAPM